MTEQGGQAEPAADLRGAGLPSQALRQRAGAFATELLELPPRSPGFAVKVASISSMGEPDVRAAAALSDRFLTRDVGSAPGRPDAQGLVADALSRLRGVVSRLAPAGTAGGGLRRLLRRLPGDDSLADYFAGFDSAQDELDAILVDLVGGQDGLRRDNAVIEAERASALALLARLEQYEDLCAQLDAVLVSEADALTAAGRGDAADVVRTEALTAVRRRRVDLATSHAVTLQGQLVLDVVRDTNLELIRGVDRAQRTTLVALRTAVAVAEARQHQTLVLGRIAGLGAVVERALEPGASPDDLGRLTTAFNEVVASIDAIDDLRSRSRAAIEAGRR